MKANNFIKGIIVVITIILLGYIYYSNRQAAKVDEMVNAVTEPYNFSAYVDSVCDVIKISKEQEARTLYNSLYEEIDVVTQILKSDSTPYISISEKNKLFMNSFNAYWPIFRNKSSRFFAGPQWGEDVIKNEIQQEASILEHNQGLQAYQIDSLRKYQKYISGYKTAKDALYALEHCKSARTYRISLQSYKKYPYCNMLKLQTKINGAHSKAKEYWKAYLISSAETLKSADISTESEFNYMVQKVNDWKDEKASYIEVANESWADQELNKYDKYLDDKIDEVIERLNSPHTNI